MNGDAIYYDNHHLHDDGGGGGESISVFDDIWEGGNTTTHAHKHRYIEKLP